MRKEWAGRSSRRVLGVASERGNHHIRNLRGAFRAGFGERGDARPQPIADYIAVFPRSDWCAAVRPTGYVACVGAQTEVEVSMNKLSYGYACT